MWRTVVFECSESSGENARVVVTVQAGLTNVCVCVCVGAGAGARADSVAVADAVADAVAVADADAVADAARAESAIATRWARRGRQAPASTLLSNSAT
jgi:hypothetical protein